MPGKEYANKPYYNESSAGERMIRGYPSPNLFNLFKDYMLVNEMGMSSTVSLILKDFFDRMAPEDKARLREQADKARQEDQAKTA